MEKLPDIFSQFFLKEGVVHAIEQLAAMQPSPLDASKAAAVDKGKGRRSGGGGNRPASRAADKDGGASEGGDARTPAGDTLRSAVGVRARRFNARYFTDDSGRTVGELRAWRAVFGRWWSGAPWKTGTPWRVAPQHLVLVVCCTRLAAAVPPQSSMRCYLAPSACHSTLSTPRHPRRLRD